MLPDAKTYEELVAKFRWDIPEFYNMGRDVCDRWAEEEPERLALTFVDEEGTASDISFGALRDSSNRLANLLTASGLKRGDRVGILLPQLPETAYAHIATYKAGAIAVPLFMLFGPEALEYRLSNSGARMVITDTEGAGKLETIRPQLPDLEAVFTVDGVLDGTRVLPDELQTQSDAFETIDTHADDPALLIYTSGTTGPPKGALHGHRALLGHLPGVEMSHDLFPRPGDKIWTPADWAWIGGLLDVLLPALHHGVPVVARRFEKFSGEAAFQLIQDFNIRNAFLPPTALKMMRAVPDAGQRWKIDMRTVASGGETLGSELLAWGREVLGVTINEFYGQTECNMIVSSCGALMPPRPGIMGRAVPGHEVAIVGDDGNPLPDGEQGHVAVRWPDPVMFLEYWDKPDATRAKFAGDWLLTGDAGIRDADGWIRFVGRDDDVITSSGYRIGPGEIEDCLIGHAAVKMAGVVGKPDPDRTEIVKAFVLLAEDVEPSPELAREIQDWVRERLAAHEYPREIEFVDELPLTATGKLIRKELRARG
ncbi:MAG: acyl-CoA synthetase [Pseudomonadota bacterium]